MFYHLTKLYWYLLGNGFAWGCFFFFSTMHIIKTGLWGDSRATNAAGTANRRLSWTRKFSLLLVSVQDTGRVLLPTWCGEGSQLLPTIQLRETHLGFYGSRVSCYRSLDAVIYSISLSWGGLLEFSRTLWRVLLVYGWLLVINYIIVFPSKFWTFGVFLLEGRRWELGFKCSSIGGGDQGISGEEIAHPKPCDLCSVLGFKLLCHGKSEEGG